jgi:hypothetical protein
MKGKFLAAVAVTLLACGVSSAVAHAEFTSPIAFSRDTVPADFCQVVRQDLLDGEFTQLEATHKAAQSLEARFEGGQTELEVFYDGLADSDCAGGYSCKDDPSFDNRRHRLEEWLSRKSDPATANLALARLWWDGAWEGRGCGFANTVSSQQWAVFGDRLKIAAGYAHKIDAQSDAESGHLLLTLARDFNLPQDQIAAVFRHARERFPAYFLTYQEYGTMTLEKWSGRRELTPSFVQSLAFNPGGDAGAVAYAMVAQRLFYEFKADRIYTVDTGLDWPKVKQAFATREKLYGLNARDWNMLCYLAYVAQDRPAAREAFKHADDGAMQTWPWTRGGTDFYHEALPWIMDDGSQP